MDLHSILSAKVRILCGTTTKKDVEHSLFLIFLSRMGINK